MKSLPVRITAFILLNSFNFFIAIVAISYLHPDFSSGYLIGKSTLFQAGWFPAGLYWHAFTATPALLLISLLVFFRIEKYPSIHRNLGKSALILTVVGVVPSGWILSYYAMGGIVGKLLFFLLASVTGFCAMQGWQAIRSGQKNLHRSYMHELLWLLASAILLRLVLYVFHLLSLSGDIVYNTAAFLSWVPTFLVYLGMRKVKFSS